ncbi:MAG: WG repeat-containing protein [Chitinophagaceae bacterium]
MFRNSILGVFIVLFYQGLSAQLVPFRVNNLWGYSNLKGDILIPGKFDFTDFFQDSIGFVMKDSMFYAISTKGEILNGPYTHYGYFNHGLCPVQEKNGHCYYINQNGKTAIDKGFNAAENFSEGLAVVSLNKKLGIINTKGEWIRQPDFDTSSVFFKSGYLLAISKGKYFYINRLGQTLNLPDTVLPGGIFSEGLAPVYVIKPFNSDGQKIPTNYLEFIDSTGQVVLNHFINDGIDYSEYIRLEKEFRDGKAIIKTRNELGWDYFFLDKKGRFSPLYSTTRHLGDSLFLGAIGYYMSDIRIVDSNYYVAGQFQQKPTQVGEFGNGLLPFRDKEGNWGYVNSNCQLKIPAKYSAAFPFKNGFAFVILMGRQGVIDTTGREYFIDK